MFRSFADWVATTPISATFQDQMWIIPTSQSIHIIAVSIVFASALTINLRLFGIGSSLRSVSQVTNALWPWIWRGLLVLLATGIVQTIAEPVRQFVTPEFWVKMTMIIINVVITGVYANAVRRHSAIWDKRETRPSSGTAFAVVSTLLWVGIIVCGRLIGYVWSFYA